MANNFKETMGNIGLGLLAGAAIGLAAVGNAGIEAQYSEFINSINDVLGDMFYEYPSTKIASIGYVSRSNISNDGTPDNVIRVAVLQLSTVVAVSKNVNLNRKIVVVLEMYKRVFPNSNLISYSELEELRRVASKRF